VVSTTTSLYDTELLDIIEEKFEARYSIDVYFISVGTGLAIKHAERGDADMILVHAPSKELSFLDGGYGVCRKIVAYNFFAIVGPEADPANIKDLSPTQALLEIVETGRSEEVKWVSRGDDSGTHTKEKGLWTATGLNWTTLRNEGWYVEAGAGMGKTLQISDNLDAYTLADVGTYLKYYKDGIISLKTLVIQGEELLNVYSAIAGNQARHSGINFDGAITFMKFLISEEGQETIANFGKDLYGQSLLYPAVNLLIQNTDPTMVQWIRNYAFFDGYECPPEYQDDHPELYT
jgi:tungstate transport system substrate-binding protein